MQWDRPFDFSGKVAVVTGGSGVICSVIASALAECGARVAIVGRRKAAAEAVAAGICRRGGEGAGFSADVLDKEGLESLAKLIIDQYGRVDFLLNGAGGAVKRATTSDDVSFFDLPEDALREAWDLNLMGTVLPSQVFARYMVAQGSGAIVNISSMGGIRPLTRQVAYSAAKAAVINFTQWLAIHIAVNYTPAIRVNAIAPGFLLTEQNRFLLTEESTGELTERGQRVIAHTPMGRFGQPEDLIGPTLALFSEATAFMTGAVIPVDGGLSAFGGV